MNWMIIFALVLSVIAFFVVVGLCIAHSFGFLKTHVQRKEVNKMFAISVVTLLLAVGGFVTVSFRYLSFSATPYLGFMDSIVNIQKVLMKEGLLHDCPDGILGPNTFAAIRQFQEMNNLHERGGEINKETIDKLFNWKSRTSSPINKEDQALMRTYLRKPSFNRLNEQSIWLQSVLKNTGCYSDNIDGILRPEILEAVRDFQRRRGILSDGTIGPDTLLCAVEHDINRFDISNRLKNVESVTSISK